MKKVKLIAIIILAIGTVSGCQKAQDTKENDPAYIGQTKEDKSGDAINTFQTGSEYKIIAPMEDLKAAVIKIIGDRYWPDEIISNTELEELTGISEDLYLDYLAEYQHSKIDIDTLIIIRAKEDKIQEVELLLNNYRDSLLQQYEEQFQNKAKVTASRIETIENYICFVQLGADTSEYIEEGEERIISICQQENERAVDAIEKAILE